jgi:hypothetical protein
LRQLKRLDSAALYAVKKKDEPDIPFDLYSSL